jgi:hypothetical protein
MVYALVFLGTVASVYTAPWPFIGWTPSVIAVYGGFPVLCVRFPYALLAGLTSIDDVVEPYLYSTTGIGSMDASNGDKLHRRR